MLSTLVEHPWAYPALEVVHLVGMALLVGNLVLFEWRVWARASELPLRPLARQALSLAVIGFVLSLLSGAAMFASQWAEFIANPAFRLKMAGLLLAGANAVWFHRRQGLQRMDRLARVQTVLSLGLWLLVLACGRFIAYV